MELPKWCNTILTNEFDEDPYWYESIDTDIPEAYYAIVNLQKSPKDFNKYLDAVYIYDKYIGQIIDYYGGLDMIMMYAEEHNGEYPPGYRDRPKLKMSKKNVAIMKSGNVPIEMGTFIKPLEPLELRDLSDAQFSTPRDDNEVEAELARKKFRKRALKIQERGFSSKDRHERIGNDTNSAASYDIVAQYFASQEGFGMQNIDDIDASKMSIEELAEYYDMVNNDRDDGWEPVTNTESFIWSEQRLLSNRKASDILDWSRVFVENGFEHGVRKRLKKLRGRDASYANFVARELGISTKSKKELKKQKKRWKKYEGSLSESRDQLRSLAHSLSRASSGIASDIDGKIFDDIIKRR